MKKKEFFSQGYRTDLLNLWDQNWDKLSLLLHNDTYFVFRTNEVKIKEGIWTGEYFHQKYTKYYPCGKPKLEAYFDEGWKVGKWIYFKRNGAIRRIKEYPNRP